MNFSLKKLDISKKVYDIQVKNNPTFTVGRSKLVVHNCFLSYMQDSSSGLVDTLSEVNTLSMLGGGVGIGVDIRSADDKSVGVMPHLKVYDASCLAYKQGTTRRGSYATYLDISHPDIIQFLEMRKPTGDQNMRTLNLNHAINITDDFMKIIERCMVDPKADDSWNLVQPNSGKVVDTVSAKELWMRILEMRMQTGEPYIWFNDTANEALPAYQKAKGLRINGSNLCLTGDTLVDVEEAGRQERVTLEELVTSVELGFDVKVKSLNTETGVVEYKPVTAAAMTAKSAKLIKVTDTATGKFIRCTPDHKVWTKNRGYVEAKLLVETDELDIG